MGAGVATSMRYADHRGKRYCSEHVPAQALLGARWHDEGPCAMCDASGVPLSNVIHNGRRVQFTCPRGKADDAKILDVWTGEELSAQWISFDILEPGGTWQGTIKHSGTGELERVEIVTPWV